MLKIMDDYSWPNFSMNLGWGNVNVTNLVSQVYTCGYCSNKVSSSKGYPIYLDKITREDNCKRAGTYGGIYICPECKNPSYFYEQNQIPGALIGKDIEHLPEELEKIYDEIRKNISNNCYTSAVLLSRKLLMNFAVEQGADVGLKFIEYVNYLEDNRFTPPKSRDWVDSIRKKGNEATHEIELMDFDTAKQLLIFLEMLLIFNYSFINMIP